MRLFAGFWGCLLMAIGCLLWLDHRDRWDNAWLYFSLPLLFAGSIAWDLWTHKGQTMNFSKEFKEELLSEGCCCFPLRGSCSASSITCATALGPTSRCRCSPSQPHGCVPGSANAGSQWMMSNASRQKLYDLVAKALTPFGTRRRDAAKSSNPCPGREIAEAQPLQPEGDRSAPKAPGPSQPPCRGARSCTRTCATLLHPRRNPRALRDGWWWTHGQAPRSRDRNHRHAVHLQSAALGRRPPRRLRASPLTLPHPRRREPDAGSVTVAMSRRCRAAERESLDRPTQAASATPRTREQTAMTFHASRKAIANRARFSARPTVPVRNNPTHERTRTQRRRIGSRPGSGGRTPRRGGRSRGGPSGR